MANSQYTPPDGPPLAHSINGAQRRANIGRTTIYAEIRAGRLKVRKCGRRTVVLDADLRDWLASLPMRAA